MLLEIISDRKRYKKVIMQIRRFIVSLVCSSLFSTATYAEVKKQTKLNFNVVGEALNEDIHYSFAQGSASVLKKNFPHIAKLDSVGFLKEKGASVVVSKVAYVIKKPIGFFDHENLVDEKLVSELMGQQKVRKVGNDGFYVAVPGKEKLTYRLKIYVDSDDVSTLPHSRVTESITSFKKLDVISQSASSISFREMSDFSDLAWGAVMVNSFIPLKENKTLVIGYYLSALRVKGNEKQNEANLRAEFESTKMIMERFR